MYELYVHLFFEFLKVFINEMKQMQTINILITCPVQSPTTKSAMKVSSVSPERWLTITPHPLSWAILHL